MMLTYDTASFKITLTDEGVIFGYPQEEPRLRKQTVLNGQLHTEFISAAEARGSEAELIRSHNSRPTFALTYAGNNHWESDLDAGMQRWHGQQTLAAVRKGFRKAGLTPEQIAELLIASRKHKGAHCPRYF